MTRVLIAVLSLVFLLGAPTPASADSESMPSAYVVASKGGRFYLKMTPSGKRSYARPYAGKGVVYQVRPKGRDKLLWSMRGWYAFQTFLSHDGNYVVRIGDWPRGRKPSSKHLAIAFYKRGKLLARYSTKQLIRDTSKVSASISHYFFKKSVRGFLPYSHRFEITMVDGVTYQFDARTGKIMSTNPLVQLKPATP